MRRGILSVVVAAFFGVVVCEPAGAAALVPVEIRLSASATSGDEPTNSPPDQIITDSYGKWTQAAQVTHANADCTVTFSPYSIAVTGHAHGEGYSAGLGRVHSGGYGIATIIFDVTEPVKADYAFAPDYGSIDVYLTHFDDTVVIAPDSNLMLDPGRYKLYFASVAQWPYPGILVEGGGSASLTVPEPSSLCTLLLAAPLLLARRRRRFAGGIVGVALLPILFCAPATQAQVNWLSQDRYVKVFEDAEPTPFGLEGGFTGYTHSHVTSAPDFGRFVCAANQDSSIGENQIVAKGHGDCVMPTGGNLVTVTTYTDSSTSVTFHVSEPMQWDLLINRLDSDAYCLASVSLGNGTDSWYWSGLGYSGWGPLCWTHDGPPTSGVLQPGDWTFKAWAGHNDYSYGYANYDVVLTMQAVPEPAGLCGLLLAAPLLLMRRRAV